VFILVAALVGMLVLTWIIRAYPAGAHLPRHAAGSAHGLHLGINTDRVISLVFVIGRRWPVWLACW
jgi:branched-chain amino acid transport system permease protein